MKTKSPVIISVLLLGLLVTASVAPAAVSTWTNLSGGVWSTGANWSAGTAPGVADDVFIAVAGTYTVTQDVHVTVASLTLGGGSGTQTLTNPGYILTLNGVSAVNGSGVLGCGGGTLAGAGIVTVGGKVVWTGGAIGGAITVVIDGTLEIGGSGTKYLSGNGTLVNQGAVVWSGPNDIQTGNSARIINQPGALFDIQNNQSLAIANGGAITNFGTLRKSAGGGNTIITVPLYNSGTLEVQSGLIAYSANAGNQFNDGTAFTGTGTNLMYAGTATFNGGIYSTNLEIAGATLAGNGVFSGIVNWTSGDLTSGMLTVATNGVLHIRGSTLKNVSNTGTLVNFGSVVWSGANDIQTGNSARIINQPGALFEIQNNQSLALANGGAITNLGVIRKSAGGGNTFITVPLINSGILDVQSGLIAYGAANHFNDGTTFTGSGTNLVYTGTATFDGAISSANLELGGAAIAGSGSFSGVVNWTSGDLSDNSTFAIATNGVLNIKGSGTKNLWGTGTLINYGSIAWSGSNDLNTLNSSRIINQPGALFDIQNNQSLTIWNGGAITNLGTIRKSAGGGSTVITVPLYNFGTLDVQSGTIGYGANVGSQFNIGTAFIGVGTNLIYAGTVTFNDAIFSENLELGGATLGGNGTFSGILNWTSGDLHDGTLTIATNGVLNIKGLGTKNLWGTGALINYGLIAWSGSNDLNTLNSTRIINQPGALFDIQNNQSLTIWNGGAITNLGTFRKSSGGQNSFIEVPFRNLGTVDVQSGTITFQNYTQTGGKLSFGLNSLTNFGRIAFANNVVLSGTLGANLNDGYVPVAGDAFAVISYPPPRTGTFGSFNLPATHAWQTNSSIYDETAVTLIVLNARPTLDPIPPQTGDEETAITFTATATDPDPGQTWSFGLVDAPPGATINTNTGAFAWTPTEAQGPSTNKFAVQVSDNGTPVLTHTQKVTVVVNEVNRVPVATTFTLAPIAELVPFVLVTNLATDPDLPTNTLSFSLINPPDGMLIDGATGVITWTPSEAQGPSTNAISVRITDSGSPRLSATNTFTLVITEVNAAPSLAPLANLTHVAGAIRWITNSASDSDLPANQLLYSLVNPPPGMNIGPTSGLVIWAPPRTCAPLTNTVTVRVTDNGSPPLMDEKSFVATLISVPRLRIADAGPNLVVLSWPAAATEAGFVLQSTTNLLSPVAWGNVAGTPNVIAGENFLTNDTSAGFRAYRLASALTPLPTLRIAAAGPSTVSVSWPATATAIGFVPQAAPNWLTPVVWNDTTNSVGTNGSFNFIMDPLVGTQRYYRLRLPALP